MNPLPCSPLAVQTPELRRRYFRNMQRWGFNIAYNAFYAFPLRMVRGEMRMPYIEFARMARSEGYPACIQIQSTVAEAEDLPLSESQYYLTNFCQVYKHHASIGSQNFFASFSSRKWRRFLKDLSQLFHDYGYRWIVFEEPMFRVDIPGAKDRFYRQFRRRFPDLPYPDRHTESEAYRRVQAFKQQVLLEFLQELARHAKAVGYEKVGVMPWFFTPTHENTPEETWHSACDLGRIHHLPEIDFIVARMQPDNLFAGAMTEQDGLTLPWHSYLENLAHQGGKPIIAVNNPTNEHLPRGSTEESLLPYEYFSRYTLAAAVAAPNGMTRHWYDKHSGQDRRRMALYARVNPLLDRLGGASSSLALVYSYRALVHALPRSAKQLWTPYARLAYRLLYEAKTPALTLYAGSLAEGLSRAPEVSTLVLFEEYPVSPGEVELLRRWVASDPHRRLVLFGRGKGESYDLSHSFFKYTGRPPEMVELFGLRADRPLRQAGYSETAHLRFTGKSPKDAFLGKRFEWRCYGWGSGTFKKSKHLEALYTEERTGTAVITRYQYPGGGQAYFVAQGLEGPHTNFPFSEFLGTITNGKPAPCPRVECSTEVLWNATRNAYLIIANTAPEEGWIRLDPGSRQVWNVEDRKFETSRATRQKLEGEAIRLYRIIARDDPILDVEGPVYLSSISAGKQTAEITGYFLRKTVIRTRLRPRSLSWLGQNHPHRGVARKDHFEIHLGLDEPAEGTWRLEFS